MPNIAGNTMYEVLNHSKVNESSQNETIDNGRDMFLAKCEIAVQSVTFAVAVLGNATVLITLYRIKKNLTRMQRLMAHLATADLFVAFGSLFPQLMWDIIYPFQGGDVLCKIVKYLQVVTIYAASYILVVTAIDRFIAICYPFVSHTWPNKRTDKMVGMAWILSLFLSIPQMVIFSMQWTMYDTFDCWASFSPVWTATLYTTIFTFLVYIFPTLILGYCYGRICVAVWSSGRVGFQLKQGMRNVDELKTVNISCSSITNDLSERESIASRTVANLNGTVKPRHRSVKEKKRLLPNEISAKKLKTIKLTLTVVCCYFVCWTPFFIAQLWTAYDANAPFSGKWSLFSISSCFMLEKCKYIYLNKMLEYFSCMYVCTYVCMDRVGI
ncbi:hypothetical protein ACJMK2_014000 [Sinanodonta woodiana]|uniref:G-protein coupled receptors family 1 profile domain-containing protein n=1 Tax=Sinanodonta woodiana TaxID=1069815 RepID=A0ABD3UZ79_SINWO